MGANEKGFSTILALGIIAVVFLLVLSGLMMVGLATQLFTKQLTFQGQAQNAAEAGLVDALNYFRRAGNGAAVTNFDPELDPIAIPPLDDTSEPTVGIVRTFQVSKLGNVCGRYEVRRQDLDDDGTIDPEEVGTGVQDVTNNKGRNAAGPGNVWLLESHGLIFVDNDGTLDCDFTAAEFDNNGDGVWQAGEDWDWSDVTQRTSVIVMRTLRTQIQRMSLILPGGKAAINAADGTDVSIGVAGDDARVLGGTDGIGIAYSDTSATAPTIATGADVQGGGGATFAIANYKDSILDVFGITESELIASADNAPIDISSLPASWSMKLIVVQGSGAQDFLTTKPLIGSGVLVVLGSRLTVPAGSTFQGIIYVKGDYVQDGPSLVSGSVIVQGSVDVNGSGDFAEVDFDENIFEQVQAEMIQYRFGRNPYLYTSKFGYTDQY